MADFVLDVFRFEKSSVFFAKKFQMYPVKSKKQLFFRIFQPVSAGLSRDYPHCAAADNLWYKTLLQKQQFDATLRGFQR